MQPLLTQAQQPQLLGSTLPACAWHVLSPSWPAACLLGEQCAWADKAGADRCLDLGNSSFGRAALEELAELLPRLPRLQLCVVTLLQQPPHNMMDLSLKQVRSVSQHVGLHMLWCSSLLAPHEGGCKLTWHGARIERAHDELVSHSCLKLLTGGVCAADKPAQGPDPADTPV